MHVIHCSLRSSSSSAFPSIHYGLILTALDPLQNLRHAPHRKRVRQTGSNNVAPETIESFLVVVLLKVATLHQKQSVYAENRAQSGERASVRRMNILVFVERGELLMRGIGQ